MTARAPVFDAEAAAGFLHRSRRLTLHPFSALQVVAAEHWLDEALNACGEAGDAKALERAAGDANEAADVLYGILADILGHEAATQVLLGES